MVINHGLFYSGRDGLRPGSIRPALDFFVPRPTRYADTPERRHVLKEEYQRTLDRANGMLAVRPDSQTLVVSHGTAIADPHSTAERINDFLGGGLDVEKMAMAVDPTLYRNRSGHCSAPARLQ